MSTRWYPFYVKGSPQLRVFLPNFWMKLVNREKALPPNEVEFIVSTEMTKFDVKNYLEKIYKVPVVDVRTHIHMGEIKKQPEKGYIMKDDDYKIAHVTLPRDYKFEFPNIFPTEKEEDKAKDLKQMEGVQNRFNRIRYKNRSRPGLPTWFGL